MPVALCQNASKNNLLWAIGANAVILAFFLLFTTMKYAETDDSSLSSAIALNGYYYFTFTNYFLNALVGFIQKITPFWNAWVGCQISFSFIAFVAISYAFFEKARDSLWMKFLGVLIVVIFAYDHYASIQFSQTAALLMVAGTLLTIHAIINTSGKPALLIGCLLFLIGTWYRFSGVYAALCFAAIFAAFSAFCYRKELFRLLSDDKAKRIQIALVVVFVFMAFATHEASQKIDRQTPELKAYTEYNSARAQFMDHPKPDYDENAAFFEELGISKAAYTLMGLWVLDYNTVASLENLKKINEFQSSGQRDSFDIKMLVYQYLKKTRDHVRDFTHRGINTIFLMMLAVFALIAIRFRYWPKFIVFALAYLALYLYLYYLGHRPYRASYIIDLAAIAWCAYSIHIEHLRPVFVTLLTEKTKRRASVAVVILLTAATGFLLNSSDDLNISPSNIAQPPIKEAGEIGQYINSHPEKVFVFTTRTNSINKYRTDNYSTPLMPLSETAGNTFSFGGWSITSPYHQGRLAKQNLANVFGDIIDNESVFVVEFADERIQLFEDFFTEYYAPPGKTIFFDKIETGGDVKLWQVKTKP